jgi:hypothetical protein
VAFWAVQVVGVHPHTFGLLGVPPPQVWGAVQVPQLIGLQPAIPGSNDPQLSPGGQAVGQTGEHVPVPLHALPARHVPQLMTPPQPSGTEPHT